MHNACHVSHLNFEVYNCGPHISCHQLPSTALGSQHCNCQVVALGQKVLENTQKYRTKKYQFFFKKVPEAASLQVQSYLIATLSVSILKSNKICTVTLRHCLCVLLQCYAPYCAQPNSCLPMCLALLYCCLRHCCLVVLLYCCIVACLHYCLHHCCIVGCQTFTPP